MWEARHDVRTRAARATAAVGRIAAAALGLWLLFVAVYGAWPVLVERLPSQLVSAVLVVESPGVRLPASASIDTRDLGPIDVRCEPGPAPGKARCLIRQHRDSVAAPYEVVERALGWRMRPAVEDMRIHAAMTPWPLANELLQWLVPCTLLALAAGWPTRGDLHRGAQALVRSPWLPLLPVLLAGSGWTWAASRGGYVHPTALGLFAAAPVLLGPLQEELLFRGVAVRWMRRLGVGVLAQGVLTTAAFVLLHAAVIDRLPAFALFAAAAGGGLFWVRHRHDSLALCILLHALANALLIHVVVRP